MRFIHHTRFKHIYGIDGQFVLPEHRHHWMPINDADYDCAPDLPEILALGAEDFYAWDTDAAAFVSDGKLMVFSEEALKIERQRLDALALDEVAKNLRAAQAEYDLQALLEKIDFHLKQDDIYK